MFNAIRRNADAIALTAFGALAAGSILALLGAAVVAAGKAW